MEVILIPVSVPGKDLAQLATLCSMSDTSPAGSAIFSQSLDLALRFSIPKGSRLIEPTAVDDLSGVDLKTRKIRKGSRVQIEKWVNEFGRTISLKVIKIVDEVESRGNRAFVVADEESELGVIEVSDTSRKVLL
jgi:high-affinity K+ transport system ATPase subunit B